MMTGTGGTPASGGRQGSGGMPGASGGSSGGGSCEECSRAMCDPDADGCWDITNAGDKSLCESVLACFLTNTCASGGDATRCFCGTAGAMCWENGAADGPCLDSVFAAAKVSSGMGSAVRVPFSSGSSPLGRASNLLICQAAVCPTECAANLGL